MKHLLGVYARFCWCPLIIGLVSAAQASQQPSDTIDPIIVTGTRLSPEEIENRAREFVRRTVAQGDRPVARWVDPVCPSVLGLQERYARIVERKLREIAREAGVSVASETCQANIAVSFTTNARAVARIIAERAPRRLEETPSEAREALLEGVAPIRWWYTTEARGRDGISARTVPPPFAAGNTEGGGPLLPANIPTLQHYGSSIVSTQSVRALRTATILIDMGQAEGVSLDAVASYVALVALAEIRTPDFEPTGSILALFRAADAPQNLTDWDRAFLSALYRLPLDREARLQRSLLISSLIEAQSVSRSNSR